MNNIINYIKKDWINLLQHVVIAVAAFGIAVSPFVVDYNTLPKGFELPKVMFYQIICSILIVLSLFIYLSKSGSQSKFKTYKSFYLVVIISILFIISTIVLLVKISLNFGLIFL